MRPTEIKREIERLTVDASSARSQLGVLKQKLSEALRIVAELRAASGAQPVAGETASAGEGTPASATAQEEAGSAG